MPAAQRRRRFRAAGRLIILIIPPSRVAIMSKAVIDGFAGGVGSLVALFAT